VVKANRGGESFDKGIGGLVEATRPRFVMDSVAVHKVAFLYARSGKIFTIEVSCGDFTPNIGGKSCNL
jgi:hypothetical protein